jgi:catechol 2,3-dioxygenase-like lactoylglutathione lyase family enzyme
MISGMRSVTIGVASLEKSLALYRDTLELQVESDAAASSDLLRAWGLPDGTTARLVELSCRGYPVGRLRLAAFDPAPTQPVRDDHGDHATDTATDVGPKAIDFYVRDPIGDAVERIESAGYHFRSPPVRYEIGASESEECLFTGPSTEPALLMVGHRHSPAIQRKLPGDVVFSEIATTSVVCGDIEATRRLYRDAIGHIVSTDAEVGDEHRALACKLTGVPDGTRIHFLVVHAPGEPSGKLLFVHFFDRTGKVLDGRMRPGNLGVSLFSYTTSDMGALRSAVEAAGAVIETEPTLVEDGRRIMLVRGPSAELLEFVAEA